MLRTEANAGGLPMDKFDEIRQGATADRSQLYQDIASSPFFGANRPDAKVSQGMIDSLWLQGMQAGHKNTFDCIKAFSEPDFTEDLRKFDVPIGTAALSSVKLIKNAILKIYPGAPHGHADTHKDQLITDLLAFIKTGGRLVGAGLAASAQNMQPLNGT